MLLTRNFTPGEWGVIINEFSASVKEGKYERIPYTLWRNLAKAYYAVVVNYESDSDIYNVIVDGAGIPCEKNDKSFGQYFSDSNLMNSDNKNTICLKPDINLKEFAKEFDEKFQPNSAWSITANSNDIAKASTLAMTATNRYEDITTIDTGIISNTASYYPSKTKTIISDSDISDCTNTHPPRETILLITEDKTKKENKKEEVKNMKGCLNFDFGPCTGDQVRMSMYGPAVKNANGTYVSYDAANDSIMNVDIFNFDASKFLFKMPCAIKDITVGDVIVHQRCPMYVVNVPEDGKSVIVVDITAGERKAIMPTKSPFGFNFVTKVVNLFSNMMTANPTADNPFGNMLPFMLMENSNDFDPMMFMFMNNSCGNMNPMMLYMMAKDKDGDDFMKYFMLSNMMS